MGSDALAQAGAGATAIEANRLAGSASGQEASFPGKKTDFRGFNRYEVATGRGTVSVVCPKHNLPGKPWMWRSMFWGGESRAVKRVTNSDLKLVEKGYHVVVAPGDVSGHPRGNAKIDAQSCGFESHAFRFWSINNGLIVKWTSHLSSKEGCRVRILVKLLKNFMVFVV